MSFVIFTEATCDLSKEYATEHNVNIFNLPCYINEELVEGDPHKFYELMRSGVMPTTSMLTPEHFVNMFEPYLQKGQTILYMVFSSALSGTYNSALKAKEILDEKYPNMFWVLDTKSASMGQGLLVDYAVKLRDEGKSINEVFEILQKDVYQFCHYFTVDNLFHLYRGGRVSKVKAILGTLLQLKPVLHVDEQGRLIPLSNARGRKKSLKMLVELMANKCKDKVPEKVFISHGDAPQDAEYVANLVREQFGITDITIGYIGPIIGAHSGPNTVAIFFQTPQLR